MKTTKIAALLALGLAFVSGSAMAESAIDRYNASLNTPAAKAQLLRSTCSNANGANLALCDKWKRDGVPDSDVRIGLVATGLVVGGGAGAVAASVPFGALGGNTLLGQWGVTSIAGWAPTVAVTGATGALIGTTLGGTSYLVR